jgi:hypothetical protein
MSDDDLLQALEDKRQYSDLIEELCQRIENSGAECPVCNADIRIAKRDLK